jgi:hypothetical protein
MTIVGATGITTIIMSGWSFTKTTSWKATNKTVYTVMETALGAARAAGPHCRKPT